MNEGFAKIVTELEPDLKRLFSEVSETFAVAAHFQTAFRVDCDEITPAKRLYALLDDDPVIHPYVYYDGRTTVLIVLPNNNSEIEAVVEALKRHQPTINNLWTNKELAELSKHVPTILF